MGQLDDLFNMVSGMSGISEFQMGGGLGGGPFGGGGAAQQQAQMNAWAQQNAYKQPSQSDMAGILGFTTPWNFSEPKPEQYGPWPPPMREWRYETRYAEGRVDGWIPALRDPGGPLLKVAGYLAVYPVVYLLISLLKGLFFAIS